MKLTLAVVLAVFTLTGLEGAGRGQSSPQQVPRAETPQPGSTQATPQQDTPPASQPCAQSKDTCELNEPGPQQPGSAPAAKPEEKAQPETALKASGKKKTRHHKSGKKQALAENTSGPRKTIVREGGTSDPNAVLTPGTTGQTRNSRQLTADLLSATDANLKQATSRPLNPNQEQTVAQIRVFMDQANAAIKAGDLDRGHNLAIKAHLLSDDLVKH